MSELYELDVERARIECLSGNEEAEISLTAQSYIDRIVELLEEACNDIRMSAEDVVRVTCVVSQLGVQLAEQGLLHMEDDRSMLDG